jgi:hypothetical protein
MKWLLPLSLAIIGNLAIKLPDTSGVLREPLKVPAGHLETFFFVDQTCPVSNYYAHEIRRICDDYADRGIGCALIYVDPNLSNADAMKHAAEYGHGEYPKFVDRRHALVEATGATITPEAVIVKPGGAIAYRGRIDDYYADFGKPRQRVSEHDLRDALDAVLAGKPVAKRQTKPVGCYIPGLQFYGK